MQYFYDSQIRKFILQFIRYFSGFQVEYGKDANGNPHGIQYTKLTAYLIEAVKSLKNEIDTLKGNNR